MTTKRPSHDLEKLFCLTAREILDVVLRNNRTLMNLKGAVAQEHLRRLLDQLTHKGKINSFQSIDKDGQPDFKVEYRNRDFLIECKNVQKTLNLRGEMTVDFMRTRNPIGKPWLRYYAPTEFDVLAACTFNQTKEWKFRFIPIKFLARHPKYKKRLDNKVSLGESQKYHSHWSDDLALALDLAAGQS